jgi:outer membrane protein OmpA-like peptidoglycan-associated protein
MAQTSVPPAARSAADTPVDCVIPDPYIVFFAANRNAISQITRRILDNLIGAYALCGNGAITVDGYADRSGAPSYNLVLSRRRAAVVRQYLQRHGIPAGETTMHALGERRPLVETQDGVAEPQNRRVEIRFGPPHGH